MNGLERLQILVDFLEKTPPLQKDFNMKVWKHSCGTSACAVGHGASIPALANEGLKLVEGGVHIISLTPEYLGIRHIEGVALFFEMYEIDANFVFAPTYYDSCPTPQIVAARIREYIHAKTTGTGHFR